jgi:integrase
MGKCWRYEGQRYPFSDGGWRKQWYRALRAAGLWNGKGKPDNFRFHDIRHTAATRTLDETNDLYLVKELLGHAEISTTQRYAKLGQHQLLAGMEATDRKSQKMSQLRNEGKEAEENRDV